MQVLMFLAVLCTAGVTAGANRMAANAAADAYAAYRLLPAGTGVNKDVAELIGLFQSARLSSLDRFDDFLIDNNALIVRSWLFDNPRLAEKTRMLFINHYGLTKNEELLLLNDSHVLEVWLRLVETGVDRPLKQLSVLLALAKEEKRMNQVIQLYEQLNARPVFENLEPRMWQDIMEEFIFRFNMTQSQQVARQLGERPRLFTELMLTHFSKIKRNDLDKFRVADILNIMRVGLSDIMVQFLTIKNASSRAAMAKRFRPGVASHQNISEERIVSLTRGTAPELNGMDLQMADSSQTPNILLTRVGIYQGGVEVEQPAGWTVYLSSNGVKHLFKDGKAPDFIKEIAPADREKFHVFKQQAIDDEGYKRMNDTEMKFIFNFLKESWGKGDHFIIEMESTLKVCSSCEAYLVYLQKLAEQYGKKIEIHLKDNYEIKSFENLKK